MIPDPELANWLKLTLTPGLGAAVLRKLLGHYGLPGNILAAPRDELLEFIPRETLERLGSDLLNEPIQASLAWADRPANAIVSLADTEYPRALLEITDPPPLLYCRGRLELLSCSSIAVVGSRNASAQGMRDASRFSRALADSGLTVVSGLALGIDAAAHRGSLPTPASTVAVLGTGVDVFYPRSNAGLAEEIAEKGLLVSEFPLGTAALPKNFPRRNRLISGLSLGCLVVEAAPASGSLITARSAAEQGREVFAIPGSIHSPFSKGCHALIKNGAKLVESAEDVLNELPQLNRHPDTSPPKDERPLHHAGDPLLWVMGFDPIDFDSLCVRAGLSASETSAQLLHLELAGKVAALPGGFYQRLN